MMLWVVAPLATALALLGVGGLAFLRPGPPRGRGVLLALCLTLAAQLVYLAMVLATGLAEVPGARVFWGLILVSGLLWLLLTLRFGQGASIGGGRRQSLVFALLVAGSVPLTLWATTGEGMRLADGGDEGPVLAIRTMADRGLIGFVLLVAAFGVVRFHALVGAAQRGGVRRLRTAYLGPMLISMIAFLAASQELLYELCALRMLGFWSLGLVPGVLLLVPALRAGPAEERTLPVGLRVQSSSLLLMSLGLFLVCLAGLAQVLHVYLPEGGGLWRHWGGTVLLAGFALAALPTGLRAWLSRTFDRKLPETRLDFRTVWARANLALAAPESVPALVARVREVVGDLLGPTGVALWLADTRSPRFLPAPGSMEGVPPLERTNPLRVALRETRASLDFCVPPRRLDELPPFVENAEWIQGCGLRVFLALRVRSQEVGVLGLAPPERCRLEGEDWGLLENLAGQLANALWMLARVERPGKEKSPAESDLLVETLRTGMGEAAGRLQEILAEAERGRNGVQAADALVGRIEGVVIRLQAGLAEADPGASAAARGGRSRSGERPSTPPLGTNRPGTGESS